MRNEELITDAGGRQATSRTPDVLELAAASPSTTGKSQPGAVALLAARSGSSWIRSVREALLSGSTLLVDAVRGHDRPSRTPEHEPARLTLYYCNRAVTSVAIAGDRAACASMVPFTGLTLVRDQLWVGIEPWRNDQPPMAILVVVQGPALSSVEQEITRRLSNDLQSFPSRISLGQSEKLLVVDEGWAVGGSVVRSVARQLQQKCRQENLRQGGPAHGEAAGRPMQAKIDLRVPARTLLERYAARQAR